MPNARDIESELKAARQDIETLASLAADRAAEVGSAAAAMADERLQNLSEEARKLYGDALGSGKRVRQQAEAKIRDNPLAAAGIAFVIGMLVAAVLGRR